MQSQKTANESTVPLREEDTFGLGDASVSWHADSSLQNFSSIAVYHQTGGSATDSSWSIASRVIGDATTPAIKVALQDQQTYYMLNDFNHHHHHAVLAGNTWRYSSTHRVAVVGKDTWEFAWTCCQEGQQAYAAVLQQVNRQSELDPVAMRKAAESHLIVEFDWLRMYYIQGEKHAQSHAGYWQACMAQLLEAWCAYERALPVLAGYILEQGTATNQRSKRMYVWLLEELIEKRKEFRKRCRAPAYFALDKEERPMLLPESGVTVKLEDLRAAMGE